MAVVLQHFSVTAGYATSVWIPSLVPHGYMAVDFFFVLSGFIMAYTYLHTFETKGLAAYGPFLLKRVARIFPLGIAVTTIIVCCGLFAGLWNHATMFIPSNALNDNLITYVIINLAHLQGFLPQYNLNGPSGSISLEFAAYVLMPLLFIGCFHKSRLVALLMTVTSIGVLGWINFFVQDGLSSRFVLSDIGRVLAEFSLGLMVYRVYQKPSFLQSLGKDHWTWAVTALVIATSTLRSDLSTALVCPLLVLTYSLNIGLPKRIMSMKIPYFLGTISFSIYLIHNLLRDPAYELLRTLHPMPLSFSQALVFAFGCSIAVIPFAAASYFLVEKPGRTAFNRLFQKVRQRWSRLAIFAD